MSDSPDPAQNREEARRALKENLRAARESRFSCRIEKPRTPDRARGATGHQDPCRRDDELAPETS